MSLIGKSIGNYEIKSKLGEGGMGAVYLGEHPLIGKKVAVKVLLEELASKEDIVARFFNEAKAVNDIRHQNIVDIVDFGKTKSDTGGDVVYFIMEYLDGESMASRIKRIGLQPDETIHVIAQCCSALTASHDKGIVHRDLKPDNIYLCPRGEDKNFVKLLDFGIAKLTGDGGTGSSKTRTGLVIGTPAYMSPEQCEGKGLIDHRSDVYSLGVVMYELLTGRVPFPGEGFGEILVAHLTKQPDAPSALNPEIKPEIEAIVLHAIEKDRNRRFQSMREFAEAVQDPAAHLQAWSPLPGYTPEPPKPAAPSAYAGGKVRTSMGPSPTTLSGAAGVVEGEDAPAKSRAPVFVAAAAVLALAGGGAFVATRQKEAPPGPTSATPAVAQPAAPAPAPALPAEVQISVTSDPPGAKVFRADTGALENGVTPLSFTVKRGSPGFDVELRLDGFRRAQRALAPDHDQKVFVSLEKEAPAVPAPAAAAAAPGHAEKGKKPKKGGEGKGPGKKTPESGGSDDMQLLKPNF